MAVSKAQANVGPAMPAAGKTRLIREVRPLDTVNESMADVKAGRIAARVVFEL